MMKGYFKLFLWLILSGQVFGVQAACITVSGMANITNNEQSFARQMAIRNALEIASMQNNLQVISRQDTENFALKNQATQFISRSKVDRFSILSEFVDDEQKEYRVELEVCLTEQASGCDQVLGAHYQNRIVVAPVVIENPYESRDISNLLIGYQHEIFRRLSNQGYRNLEMIDYAQSLVPGNLVTPNLSEQVLQPIQDQTGAQFMLMTVIRAVGAHREGGGVSDKLRRYYHFEVKDNFRYIELDWYLVDLNKHRIAKQGREGYEVEGEVYVGRDRPFGTAAFFKTHTGQAFNLLLDKQVNGVFEHMRCELLETQVIDVRNGEYVLFLSDMSGVQVGDQLAVYQQAGNPIRFQGRNLGLDEVPSGFLKISRIMPKFAVAELVAESEPVQIGDLVRSW